MKRLVVILLALITHYAILTTNTIAQDSKNIDLLFHWEDTSLVGSGFYDNVYNEVWGVVVNGKEYAIIGSTSGTHIFDVTDPQNAYEADFIPGAQQGSIIVHRDFHDYKGYLYIVSDEGSSTLQIADLSFLPDSVNVFYDSDSLFKRSHNIFIDTATAKLYVCGVTDITGMHSMYLYSLKNPKRPEFIYAYPGPYVHDCYVRNDTAYLNAGSDGLRIVDFSDTALHVNIGSLSDYPDSGYNHSGWLSGDSKYYVFCDENLGADLKLYDVSDPSDLKFMDTFNSGVDTNSIVHNVIIKGNYIYCSYYFDGTRIFYMGDPTNVIQTGFYETYPDSDYVKLYKGNWGIYPHLPSGILLASDMQYGLFVLDATNAVNSIYDIERTMAGFKVYPNPFTENINIEGIEIIGEAFLEVYDLKGGLIFKEKVNANNGEVIVPVGNHIIGKGIYLLKLTVNDNILVEKIVKAD
ncbi:MAG: choice-of-anchor B family protein [Bacteroidia bacterium]|nr:choice-of-anchor B family protein [Bacteroidia bacterium]